MFVLDVPFGGGFALSFRWFALGVGFGRYPSCIREGIRIPFLAKFSGERILRFFRELLAT